MTCGRKRHDRINAKSKRATLPCETIVEPPVACAIWRDEQIHAAAVAQFVCLGLRLGVANARIGQRHDGISASILLTVSARDTAIDTVNFSGCKRSLTNMCEWCRNISAAIPKGWRTNTEEREQLRTTVWLGD